MPPGAAVEAAVEDQPGADAGRDLEVDEVGRAAAGAVGQLGERAEVGVVVDADRARRAAGASPRRRRRRPSRAGSPTSRSRRRPGRSGPAGRGRRRSRASGRCRPRRAPRRSGRARRRGPPARRGRCPSARRARRGCSTTGRATATRTWLWPKSIPSAAPADASNDEQDRRASALLAVRRARLLALDDEPVGLQLGDEARDGRAGEAGAARDLGAADHAVLAQRVDHAPTIEPAQRRQRALRPLPHPVGILTRTGELCQVFGLTLRRRNVEARRTSLARRTPGSATAPPAIAGRTFEHVGLADRGVEPVEHAHVLVVEVDVDVAVQRAVGGEQLRAAGRGAGRRASAGRCRRRRRPPLTSFSPPTDGAQHGGILIRA